MDLKVEVPMRIYPAGFVVLVVGAALLSSASRAEDLTGRFGVGGTVGAGVPIGSEHFIEGHDAGLSEGGWLSYGVTRRLSLRAAYDNYDFERGPGRLEAATFGGAYSLLPGSDWNPSVRAGVGPAWPRSLEGATARPQTLFGISAGAGVDKFVTPNVTVGGSLDWIGVMNQDPLASDLHVLRPALNVGYWFGGGRAKQTAAAQPPASEKTQIAIKVEFEPDQSEIKPGNDQELQAAADFLKAHPGATVEIQGHTDSTGSPDHNQALSQERADAVKDVLVGEFNADESRITTRGYGEERPIASNERPDGRAANRRVVAVLVSGKT